MTHSQHSSPNDDRKQTKRKRKLLQKTTTKIKKKDTTTVYFYSKQAIMYFLVYDHSFVQKSIRSDVLDENLCHSWCVWWSLRRFLRSILPHEALIQQFDAFEDLRSPLGVRPAACNPLQPTRGTPRCVIRPRING